MSPLTGSGLGKRRKRRGNGQLSHMRNNNLINGEPKMKNTMIANKQPDKMGKKMSLNKQGHGKIDYCDYTWNPISGRLNMSCTYCYMRQMEKRFPGIMKPTFHEKRLYEPLKLKKPSIIFVGSSGDMFGDWINHDLINQVLDVAANCERHTFLFLTKNPGKYQELEYIAHDNLWFGTTCDGTQNTADNLKILYDCTKMDQKWVSFEPLKAEPTTTQLWAYARGMNWFVIGADSTKGVEKPPVSWGKRILNFAEMCNIPVWVKDNWPELPRIKERPF